MDSLWIWFDSFRGYAAETFSTLSDWRAFLLYCPLVLYELLRYSLPVALLAFCRIAGLNRDSSRAQREFLASRPRVSIVIAGRNEGAIIAETIESLLALPYDNCEIIVVDDNSTDNMYEICRDYEKRGRIQQIGRA